MKKILSVLLVLGLVIPVFCETQAAAPAAAKKTVKKVAVSKIKGTVKSVDATNNQIVVSIMSKKEKKEIDETLSVDASATISKDGKKITLSDIIAGEKITVSYETSADGKKIVKSISVKSEAPAKVKAAEPAKK